MDIKPQSNRQRYIAIVRAMTPAQRLQKSFEITEFAHQRLKDAIRNRNPHATPAQLHQIYLDLRRKLNARKSAQEKAIASKFAR